MFGTGAGTSVASYANVLTQIPHSMADDMGLGKTWQTLTYLGGLMKADTISSALIIAPVSILRSWEKEAQKVIQRSCVPHLDIRVVSSSMKRVDRQRVLRAAIRGDNHKKGDKCLIITTYGLVSNDPQDFLVGDTGFDYVALDEGHTIKNASSNKSKSCHRVCRSGNTHRLLLSGTPIQNNLKEMWALFDFATSGRIFGPLKRYVLVCSVVDVPSNNIPAVLGLTLFIHYQF